MPVFLFLTNAEIKKIILKEIKGAYFIGYLAFYDKRKITN